MWLKSVLWELSITGIFFVQTSTASQVTIVISPLSSQMFPLVPLIVTFKLSSIEVCFILVVVLLALVCISNRFSFLVAFCLPLQSFIFFSFCIFIIITSYLYFPSSFPLPLSFFQLYLLCTYIMFENVTSCVCTTSELIPGKCVQMCVNLGMQIMNGSLKFTDRGKG